MLQRIQTVYLLLAAGLSAGQLCFIRRYCVSIAKLTRRDGGL